MVHDDGDEEDLEEYEVAAGFKCYALQPEAKKAAAEEAKAVRLAAKAVMAAVQGPRTALLFFKLDCEAALTLHPHPHPRPNPHPNPNPNVADRRSTLTRARVLAPNVADRRSTLTLALTLALTLTLSLSLTVSLTLSLTRARVAATARRSAVRQVEGLPGEDWP